MTMFIETRYTLTEMRGKVKDQPTRMVLRAHALLRIKNVAVRIDTDIDLETDNLVPIRSSGTISALAPATFEYQNIFDYHPDTGMRKIKHLWDPEDPVGILNSENISQAMAGRGPVPLDEKCRGKQMLDTLVHDLANLSKLILP